MQTNITFAPIISPLEADPTDASTKAMRESPYNFPSTIWYAYQNHDMGHRDLGRTTFLAVGPENTFKTPPNRCPDSHSIGFGWRYVPVGTVNLETGRIQA